MTASKPNGRQSVSDRSLGLPDVAALHSALSCVRGAAEVYAIDFDRLGSASEFLERDTVSAVMCEIASVLADGLVPGERVFRTHHFGFHVLHESEPGESRADIRGLGGQERLQELGQRLQRRINVHGYAISPLPQLAGIQVDARDLDPDSVLNRLRAASHATRRSNYGVPVWLPAGVDVPTQYDAVLGAELVASFEDLKFTSTFRPIIYAPTGGVATVELVLAWAHPTLGVIDDAALKRIAYRNGLARAFDAMRLDLSIQSLAAWRDQGLKLLGYVEVAPETIADRFFTDRLALKCQAAQLEPGLLIIQISEAALMLGGASIQPQLDALRHLGAAVWVEGTRHAALASPEAGGSAIVGVRIDWPTMYQRGEGPYAGSVSLSALGKIARAQGLTILASGVSTTEQAIALKRYKAVAFADGPHFGAPLSPADVPAFVRSRGSAAPPQISPFSI